MITILDLKEKREISPEEFYEEISSRLFDKLNKEAQSPYHDYPELLTKSHTAKILNVSVGTVDNYVTNGWLTKLRQGKSIRYKKSEVINLFKNNLKSLTS